MKAIKRIFLLLIFINGLFTVNSLLAQRTLIEAKIDEAAIRIGEQTQIHLTVITDKGANVQLLTPADTIMAGLEVLNASLPDTAYIENNRMTISQHLLVTSFDSALYALPPFKVIDGADTIYSKENIGLKVATVQVNADKPEEFYDIAEIWAPAFVLADYYMIIFGILITLFMICVIGYVIQRIRNKKPILSFNASAAPKLAPHDQAILELEEIKQQKLWQQGQYKEFYTRITETLRKYMVDRFGVSAMEMTSSEILAVIKRDQEAESVYDNLRQILLLADFVKFAKMNPLPDDNELSLMNSFLFVNQTKHVEYVAPEEADDENSDSDENQTITKEKKL
jgi:hypothetical protein